MRGGATQHGSESPHATVDAWFEKSGGQIVTPILGSLVGTRYYWGTKRDSFFSWWVIRCRFQALAFWSLANFQHARASIGKRVVRLNFDETCICFHQNEATGFLVADAQKRNRSGDPLVRNVSLGARRTNMTHLAFIADDHEVQTLLPQLLVVGEAVVPERLFGTIRESVSPPWTVLRQPKAWVNVTTMMTFVKALHNAVKHLQDTAHFVVYFDTFRPHNHPNVLRYLSMNGYHPVPVPSLMTWALQPLDTHVFASYKRELAVNSQVGLLLNPNTPSSWTSLIQIVLRTGDHVVRGLSWSKSFQDIGLVGHQATVSARVKKKVGCTAGIPEVSSDLPSLKELQELFPRGSLIPVEPLLITAKERPPVARVIIAEESAPVERGRAMPVEITPPSDRPWFGRTRSTSGLRPVAVSGSSSSSEPWLPSCPTMSAPPRPPPRPPFLPNAKKMPRPRGVSE